MVDLTAYTGWGFCEVDGAAPGACRHNAFERTFRSNHVLYHFELQMAGVILLGAMLGCGIWLYIKRRRDRLRQEAEAAALGSMWSEDYASERVGGDDGDDGGAGGTRDGGDRDGRNRGHEGRHRDVLRDG